jgi:hypothetical protein
MAESARAGAPLRRALWVGIVGLSLLFGCGVLINMSASPGINVKQSKAQLGCTELAVALERYIDSEANTKHEWPTTLRDLLQPPLGGPSFLRNGETDLLDRWGNPYQFERRQRDDGTEYILVKTTAPDGTPISQFGIAGNAQPKN